LKRPRIDAKKAIWSKVGWPALLAIPCALVSHFVGGLLIVIVSIALAFHDVALEPSGTPAVVLILPVWMRVAELLLLWLIWFWILGALRRLISKKP
jgi:hypothetical protein